MNSLSYVVVKYVVSYKNAPTLACSSFELHGLILIIFGMQNQNYCKNNVHISTLNVPPLILTLLTSELQ